MILLILRPAGGASVGLLDGRTADCGWRASAAEEPGAPERGRAGARVRDHPGPARLSPLIS